MITEEKVLLVFTWYRDAMMKIANRKIKDPSKNFHKTYQYIWFKKFLDFIESNDLDDTLGRMAMFSILKYAKQKKILHKGAAILQHNHIYDIVLKSLESQEQESIEKHDRDLESIVKSNKVVINMNSDARIEYFLGKDRIGAYPRIVSLYMSNTLSLPFLSVSKSSRIAINQLDAESLSELPPIDKLFAVQQLAKLDIEKTNQIKKVLGDDCYL